MKTRTAKLILFLSLSCAWLPFAPADAQNPSPISFSRDIRPLLVARCVQCHGAQKQSGGLRLDAQAFALRGGQSGPAIVPGKATESLLYQRVAAQNEDERMPPVGNRLTAAELARLKSWIDAGAAWDGEAAGQANETERASDGAAERLKHWAWQPIVRPPIPSLKTQPANPIDAFVAAKLAANGLAMSPEADRRTLIRRLSFDLLGLPPTPEQVQQFVNARDPQAYEKLVDEMLQSPRYGERWARHWLDVVHYGDTHGYDKDKLRLNAWPYRDYVIRALNEDKPYKQFVEEQIAGDVLFPGTRDGIQALGFISAGPWDFIGHAELPETKTDGKIARHLDRDDMVANTIGTFTSVTVHCAQCHNHKFDPITQEDYYSLQSVFSALDRADKKYFVGQPELTARFAQLDGRQRDLAERKRVIERDAAKAAGEPIAKLDAQIAETAKQPERAKEVAELRAKRAQLVDAAMKPETLAERNRLAAELADITKEL
ncbi:MAG: DUF1549 domain-containing protein, partial [Acidobacteria bacterium]|nr:DUF1549 domain-containing protein [Acidobacteriota bacterium]